MCFVKVRFNLKTRNVEIRTCKETVDIQNLQKAADFVRAFVYGFEVEDALALVRLDDLFVDSFEIQVPVLEQVAPLTDSGFC
jgi:RNA-binding protein PNO1